MKNDEQLFFKIEDYLRGKLPPEEAAAFEEEIAGDAELSDMVEMHRFEREGLEFMMAENLRAKIKQWEKSPPSFDDPSPASPKNYRKWWIGLLAVALLSVTVFLILKIWVQTGENSPTQEETPLPTDTIEQRNENPPIPTENSIPIADEAKKPDEKNTVEQQPEKERYRPEFIALATSAHKLPSNFYPDNQRSSGGNEKSPLVPAVEAFKRTKPDYKKAIAELLKIKREQYPAEYSKAQEMLAHAYFNDRQFDKAANIFRKMTEQNLTPAEHDQAEWFMLLSLLPDYEKQKKQVDNLLEKIANAKYNEFAEDATKLKESLSNLQR